MFQSDEHSILRCGECNKPFDKQSTLKRHGYYCRSRKTSTATRSRSCTCCAKRKARCDNGLPECSRCVAKGIECHYPTSPSARTPKSTGGSIGQSDGTPDESLRTPPLLAGDFEGVENNGQASIDVDMSAIASDPGLADLGRDVFDWGNPDVDIADFLNRDIATETLPYAPAKSPSSVFPFTSFADQTNHMQLQLQQIASSQKMSIPRPPTYTPRSLIQRPKLKAGSHGIATLILHTLRSYPRMMLHHDTLPPFIHPHLASSHVENNDMEPLDNCISLIHMVSGQVRGSQKLFWRNVRQECERLCEVYLELNKWELLAAMQALSIYIIMRLDQGETEHNNFDFLLLAAVKVTAKRFNDISSSSHSELYSYSRELSWHDWIFEESKRRLCVVYQVVNMLVYFEPASMCDLQTDLVIAPMPAKKQLWEASDELAWRAENERVPGTDFGLTVKGELVKLEDDQVGCGIEVLLYNAVDVGNPSKSTANWEEWCAGMDRFGGLVMLAASLVV